jgi:hypothetical protein
MMKTGLHLFLVLLIYGLLSCKSEVFLPPSLVFLEPLPQSVFYSGDTIRIKAEIKAERPITEIQLDLLNEAGTPLGPKKTTYPDRKTLLYDSFIVLDDVPFTTGNHRIRLWVKDGESEKRKYQNVFLEHAPLQTQAYVMAEYLSTQSKVLVWFDKFLTEQSRDTLGGDHLGLRQIPGNDLLFVSGKVSGALEARSIDGFNLIWKVNAIPNPPSPYFTFLNPGLKKFLLVGFADGFVRVYRPDGLTEASILLKEGCYAANALLAEGFLLVDEVSRFSSSRYLSIYYYPSGSLYYRISQGLDTKALIQRAQDYLWVGNNEVGGAEIRSLVLYPNIENVLVRYLGTAMSAAVFTEEGVLFFTTDTDLYRYDPAGDVLQLLPPSGGGHFLFVDPAMEVLGVVGDSCLSLVSLNNGLEVAKYRGNHNTFDAAVILRP